MEILENLSDIEDCEDDVTSEIEKHLSTASKENYYQEIDENEEQELHGQSISNIQMIDGKDTRAERRRNDKLTPIRDVWETANGNLRKCYLSGKNITVDEQLVPFRGRCPFRQHMPLKPNQCGMKIW
ncbi:hypothetical protein ILUMI_10764 [Ignelater luminosus]|uniref:PiggyBac transposable element-derived protein domain-containing protein n=1 Tax=Ignelater luminosus TaxID=2038154 RepID=A0A8K0D2N9_IGNLU|nr:hypothetical protein ILUMI_10764 [Ignelater luminosus]